MKTVIAGARSDGHAKVVLEILKSTGFDVVGFVDDDASKTGLSIRGIPVLGQIKDLDKLIPEYGIVNGIAAIGHNSGRRALAEKIESFGLTLINAVHHTVHMDSDVKIGKGNVLCQGVVIVTGTEIGNCVNIHTGATIDHDNIISDGANIGPGVHTAGRVKIGKDAFLGTGTLVIPDITISEGVITGAGTVVIRNLEANGKFVGVPAKMIS